MYEVGILLQCVFYIVGQITLPATCTCTYVQLYCSLWSAAGYCASCYGLCQLQLYQRMSATGTLPASTKQIDCRNSYDCCTFPGTLYSCTSCTSYCTCTVPVHVHKAASTKAASTKLYQLLTSGCQLVSSGCQLVSSGCQLTVQRMSANFQNKAVSKYFWNMYQLMSAAVHVLRYVLYQRIPDARFA